MSTPNDAPRTDTAPAARHYRICPLCEACCGLEVSTQGQQVLQVRGWAGDTLSDGYLCPKGVAIKDLHDDPDRLRQPLIRRSGRSSPLEPASWQEAFALIEARLPPILAEHGRDALALVAGNPSAHKMGLLLYFARLGRAAGSKNVYSASTLDQMPRQLASGLMYGHWLSVGLPDIARTELLVVIGANPLASNGSMWTVPDFRAKARALQARGGRLVVIDPRRTETAAIADQHLAIRPGADAQLLAALVHTLFDEGLVRLGSAAPWLNGVEDVRTAVQAFTPEAVAAHCGIGAAGIRQLARDLAATPRAVVYSRIGSCTQTFGTLASWLVDVLNALTGHLDAPGGQLWAKAAGFAANTQGKPGIGRGVATGRHRARVSGAPEVFGELPLVQLADEILTPGAGQVRAAIVMSANPVLSAPGGARLAQALDQLEFMVSLDIYCNETARHADVILPGLSPLEEGHYDVPFPQLSWRNTARYSAPVLTPAPGQPPEWQNLLRLIAILKGRGAAADVLALDDELLADDLRRSGTDDTAAVLAALQPWQGPERLVDLALRSGPYGDGFGTSRRGEHPDAQGGGLSLAQVAAQPGGIDLGPLQPRLPEMLRTPSGKVELAPPMLVADLPRAWAALGEPRADMLIIGRREVRSNNSWMHNLPTLAKGPERCTLQLHPADAQRLGLGDGAIAAITRDGQRIQAPVQITDSLPPGVACLPHGWGHSLPGTRLRVAAERPGVNLNAVLDARLTDPLSGNAVLSGVAVCIESAA
ncbi:molybdopterin-dependent oxidoreductase [Aquabacterium sp. OR-4]|uniref:molybdopterin-dependent oxidoreductase n=1 Tax=Aquabacterium sp. OR-4 TaxID=2978127 RepID=UPI0028C95BE3|nr:molybdopterin-dependent oxidoreductase [Aquabacterium sp. OR-4]MDT7834928.1 molybdopterin-dependent oxidoreductase [Aquabacterium sp. OR-4]